MGLRMSDHHGQWQAQGDDVDGNRTGHRKHWGQAGVPTKANGLAWLLEVSGMCTHSQRKRRENACKAARRFVRRAPIEGYPTMRKTFSANDSHCRNARIDLEVYGMAFAGESHD